jgi:hypothetical protein
MYCISVLCSVVYRVMATGNIMDKVRFLMSMHYSTNVTFNMGTLFPTNN